MKIEYISWNDTVKLCDTLAKKVEKYEPDVLVGISRGGLVPVRLLSDILGNKNIAVIKVEFYKSIGKTRDIPRITQELNYDVEGKRVLLVDDIADTGRSIVIAKDHVKRKGAKEIKVATLHYKTISSVKPDYYIKKTKSWIVYPWEIHETKKEIRKLS